MFVEAISRRLFEQQAYVLVLLDRVRGGLPTVRSDLSHRSKFEEVDFSAQQICWNFASELKQSYRGHQCERFS